MSSVWVCGSNEYGQLGLAVDKVSRVQAGWMKVVDLSADGEFEVERCFGGAEHCLLLSKDGRLFAMGDNSKQQLGLSELPRFGCAPCDVPEPVVDASCGFGHSLCIGASGRAYAAGRNLHGQCGVPEQTESFRTFTRIPHVMVPLSVAAARGMRLVDPSSLTASAMASAARSNAAVVDASSVKFVSARCGWTHSVLLDESGSVYLFGWDLFLPLLLNHHFPRAVSSIACGSYHTLCIDVEGILHVFGTNSNGQLMVGNCDNVHDKTVHVSGIPGRVAAVAQGSAYHSLAIDECGVVYGAGKGDISNGAFVGMLGNGTGEDSAVPVKVPLPEPAAFATCGWEHSLVVNSSRSRVYAFGSNAYGQCGTRECTAAWPVAQMSFDASEMDCTVLDACAGRGFSVLVTRAK
eukprot:ANDGO_06653.mRNA.1 Ultraviolet-B receptor UVR8